MSRVQLALYKGPAKTVLDRAFHAGIRWRTRSLWSHAELVIDGKCYSSSNRDGGVRSKWINLNSGHWGVIDLPDWFAEPALEWFASHEGARYDWPGVFGFVLPIPHARSRYFCFEAVGEMLGMDKTHKLDANDLYDFAMEFAA